MKLEPEAWQPPLVVLIGAGMGRDDLSLKALRWIERAEVLAGGERHLAMFPEHSGIKVPLKAPLDETLDSIGQLGLDRRVAVLASGDPFFYGVGRRVTERLGRDRVHTLPNVTTVQALFARLGEPWEDVKVISLHGRRRGTTPGEEKHRGGGDEAWLGEVKRHRAVALFTDPKCTPGYIASRLVESGFGDASLVVAEDLGLSTEAIRRLTPERAASMRFSPLNLVAVFREVYGNGEDGRGPIKGGAQGNGPVLGLSEEAFQHEAGLITKMEVRAVAIACLQLEDGQVLWDLGAGSGSVAIEAARVARLEQAFAVERSADRYADIMENARRFRCPEVRAIHGDAAEVISSLPDPDRVFIGGSGGGLHAILQEAERRLRPGGRVVQTIVTLDTLEASRSFWQDRPFGLRVIHLQASRSVPIGKTLRFDALNPVFIVTAWRTG